MSPSDITSDLRLSDTLPSKGSGEIRVDLPSFAEIANAASHYIFWVEDDPECEARFQFANDSFLETFAWSLPELCERSLKEFMSPYHYNTLRERYTFGLRKARRLPSPMIAGLKDRHGKTMEVEIVPSFVDSWNHFSAILFCSNTNVELPEKEIWESEEKYRSLVEQSRDIIFLMQRGKIVFANYMAYEILGDRLPTTNIGWRELTHYLAKEDRSRVIEFFTQALKGSIRNFSTEVRLTGKNGAILHMALKADIIAYRGEKALFGTLRDITESKKLEQEIKESEKLGTLAQFTASVAHEIRNPLEGLTSAVLLLSRGLDVQGENKDLLDVILNATNEINTTINHVVSMIREPRYKFCEMDARTLVPNAIRIVTEAKQFDPRIRVKTSFQRGLAPLYGDEAELKKSLVNLISNASQALPGEGSIRIRLANAVQDSQPFVRITIRDTGTGIPASIRPQVWEPFTTTKKKGMGMGLFITKRIVEDHGGTVRIVSTNKRGTAIEINLPAHRAKE
jgi:PAS domain S-box-containing protein